jgi:hypothetical protein
MSILIALLQLTETVMSYLEDKNELFSSQKKDTNKEFWDLLYQNSMLNSKVKYNSLNGDKVCFVCPVDRNIFTSLYHDALAINYGKNNGTPNRITISWATQFNENRIVFFCRNNTKIALNPVILSYSNDLDGLNNVNDNNVSELDYICENNKLCLINVKKSYPQTYQCFIKSYVLNVKLNVIGNNNFVFKITIQKIITLSRKQFFN